MSMENGRLCLYLAAAVEVFHADGAGEVGFERIVDVPAGELLKSGSGGVEVPLIAGEKGAGQRRPRRG
jgi:hypothetical protein